MPLALVLAHLEMLPRLKAEDQLEAVRTVRFGHSASASVDDVQAIEKELTRAINPNAKRKRAPRATPAQLAAAGIGMVSATTKSALNHD